MKFRTSLLLALMLMVSNGQAAWSWDTLCNAMTDKFDRLTNWVAERPGIVAVTVGVLAACAAVALYKRNNQADVKPAGSAISVVPVDESGSGSINQNTASSSGAIVQEHAGVAPSISVTAIAIAPAVAIASEVSSAAASQVVAAPIVTVAAAARRLKQVAPKNITHRSGTRMSQYGVSDSTTKSFTFGGSINVDLVITSASKGGKIGEIYVSDDFELLAFTGRNFGTFPALCDIKGIELSGDNSLILIQSEAKKYDTGIKLQLPHDVHVRLAVPRNSTVQVGLKTATCSCCHEPVVLESMMKCGRCKQAIYCSQDCQKEDWKVAGGNHKATCVSALS